MGENVMISEAKLNARILVQELDGYKIIGGVLTTEEDKWGFRVEKKVRGKLLQRTVWVMRDEEGTGMGSLHYAEPASAEC